MRGLRARRRRTCIPIAAAVLVCKEERPSTAFDEFGDDGLDWEAVVNETDALEKTAVTATSVMQGYAPTFTLRRTGRHVGIEAFSLLHTCPISNTSKF